MDCFKIGNLEGYIDESFYWSNNSGDNEAPFLILGVNKLKYCEQILGYTPLGGDFPYCRNMEDTIRVCQNLHKDVSLKLGLTGDLKIDSELFIGSELGLIRQVSGKFYWNGINPFNHINLRSKSQCQHQLDILGYQCGGSFPFCKSLEDLITFCNSLTAIINKPNVPLPSSMDGNCFKVGDLVQILFSSYSFNSDMETFVGKVVEITEIKLHDSKNCTIKFCNDHGWNWKYSDKHFKMYIPGKIETTIPDVFKFNSPGGLSVQGTFTLDKNSRWFWDADEGENDFPFSECHFNNEKTKREISGYYDGGLFPYCKSKEELFNFCLTLEEKRQQYFLHEGFPIKATKVDKEEEEEYIVFDLYPEEEEKSALVTPILIRVNKI